MALPARRGFAARAEHCVEGRLARAPHVERADHRRRYHGVERHGANAVRVPAQVFLRNARAVAAAPEVPLRVTERLAHRLEVGDPRRGRVLRRVHALREQFGRAGLGARDGIRFQRIVVPGLERIALHRRRTAGAALVDQDDVACAPDFVQARDERRQRRCRLTRATGEDQQWIRLGRERVRRQHRGEDPDLATVRLGAVFGNLDLRRIGPASAGWATGIRRASRLRVGAASLPHPAIARPGA